MSDLGDPGQSTTLEQDDFGEGMKSVLDAVYPDVTCPEKGDWILPTLLMPWRGGDSLVHSPRTPAGQKKKKITSLWASVVGRQ